MNHSEGNAQLKKKTFHIFILLLCFFLSSFSPLIHEEKVVETNDILSHEYELKLAFIKQFPLFITWPIEHVNERKNNPFTIGIYGENKFFPFYRNLEVRTIQGRPIKMVNINRISDINQLDILFISEATKKELTGILTQAQKYNVLTISDRTGMTQKGVMINFFIENNTVRFELNKKILDNNRFRVSSKLWRIAKIIY